VNEQTLYNRYDLISNECLVGEAKVYCDKRSKIAYLAWFEIYYPFRGRGLGREKYLELEEELREKGLKYIRLDSSEQTTGFWRSLGFSDLNVNESQKSSNPMIKKLVRKPRSGSNYER